MPYSPPLSWYRLKKRNGMGNGLSAFAPPERPFGARTRPDTALIGGATLIAGEGVPPGFSLLVLSGKNLTINGKYLMLGTA